LSEVVQVNPELDRGNLGNEVRSFTIGDDIRLRDAASEYVDDQEAEHFPHGSVREVQGRDADCG